MTDTTVKAGQVWQSKNRGNRVTVTGVFGGTVNAMDDTATYSIKYAALLDDYVLVKDAP